MKFFVVLALCIAAASAFAIPPTVAGVDAAEVQQIIEAIYHPSTDPATAAALEQMLLDILGISNPAVVEDVPIDVKPEIIDDSIISEPGQDYYPIQVGPAIIDESIISQPANYRQPLVQVIVNVNTNAPGNAVVVEQPTPVPGEVIIVDQPETVVEPEIPEGVIVAPVIIPEEPVEVPTPVIVAPIVPSPVITLPDTLN